MIDEIKKETQCTDHANYGAFILVIMSHGSDNSLYGTDNKRIKYTEIYKLMGTYKFPLMASKPRIIILQAGMFRLYNFKRKIFRILWCAYQLCEFVNLILA